MVSGGFTEADAAAFAAAAEHARAYRSGVAAAPVRPDRDYVASLAAFGEPLPEIGMPTDRVIAELTEKADPGIMGFVHPSFHGWVTGASHPAGVAADWLASAWGQVTSYAEPSPSASAAEEIAGTWLLDMLGLPEGSGFGLATGTTMANFVGLAAARNEMLARAGWDVEEKGLFSAPEVQVVLGGEAHSSVYLTLRLLGFGAGRVHIAEADDQGRMRPDSLESALNGLDGPTVVCLQAGNVNSGAFDPFNDLIPLARKKSAWVHVDGAFGLWARASRALDALTGGLDNADSWAADAHKWLQVPYDCGIAVVRDTAAMQRAMHISAAYLADSAHRDPNAFAPEMSRRARGLSLWAVIKALGRAGVAEMIERHCAVARHVAECLRDEPGLHVLNDVVLNQVVVACGDAGDARADGWTRETLRRVQQGGRAYPSHGRWRGREIIRISVCAGPTDMDRGAETADAVAAAWRTVKEQAA
ncbi:MAG: pyridoxal phosphate-dependent decarboxylase family protein [Paracoccaceae bacterium]